MNRHKIALAMLLLVGVFTSGFTSCGRPAVVNTHPTPLDTPVEITNGIVSSTRTFEGIVKRHHNAKRASIAADKTLSNSARKKAQIAETEKFRKFNDAYKRILQYSEDAAKTLQSADAGSLQTAKGQIKLASDIVVNELLTIVDDPELRDSLTALNNLMQRLIARQTGTLINQKASKTLGSFKPEETVTLGPVPPKKGGN